LLPLSGLEACFQRVARLQAGSAKAAASCRTP